VSSGEEGLVTTHPKLSLVLLVAGVAAAAPALRAQQAQRRRPAAASMAVQQDTARLHLQALMRRKVDQAELILRGLAEGDLNSVQRAADELVQIAAQANWSVTPRANLATQYEAEFQQRAALLANIARSGDLHASYYQFLQVIFACFNCHDQLRPAGYRGR
jgi:hypothetical protein